MISIPGRGEDVKNFKLGRQDRSSATRHGDAWKTRRNRVASRGDERLGLPKQSGADKLGKDLPDSYYRGIRNKPLLMLHVLGPIGTDMEARVPAFGLSFPPGHHQLKVEVIANRVWIERMQDGWGDIPPGEEDDDE